MEVLGFHLGPGHLTRSFGLMGTGLTHIKRGEGLCKTPHAYLGKSNAVV